jgi:hypothetical protein
MSCCKHLFCCQARCSIEKRFFQNDNVLPKTEALPAMKILACIVAKILLNYTVLGLLKEVKLYALRVIFKLSLRAFLSEAIL